MNLVWPSRQYLPSYVAALERGWSPDNLRQVASGEELEQIAADPDAFLIGLRWQRGSEALPPYCLGHIGYAVVPWKQGRGYATRALREVLGEPGQKAFATSRSRRIPTPCLHSASSSAMAVCLSKSSSSRLPSEANADFGTG